MKFLADENIPPTAILRLRKSGHDVLSVRESMRGHSDVDILTSAVIEQRILITFDKDFGELAFRSRLPAECGVVLLRFTHHGREEDIARIVRILHSRADWAGAFWTLTDRRLRRRTLPAREGPGRRDD